MLCPFVSLSFQYYYSIKEISVGGRCVCNGHAFVCPPSQDNPDLLKCKCEHNTAGDNCDKCAEGYVQKRYLASGIFSQLGTNQYIVLYKLLII